MKLVKDIQSSIKLEHLVKQYFIDKGFKCLDGKKNNKNLYNFTIKRKNIKYRIDIHFNFESKNEARFILKNEHNAPDTILHTDSDYIVYVLEFTGINIPKSPNRYHLLIIRTDDLKNFIMSNPLRNDVLFKCDEHKNRICTMGIGVLINMPFVKYDTIEYTENS